MNKEELQFRVNLAELWLWIDSAIQYGLMEKIGNVPDIDPEKCQAILEKGRLIGIVPEKDFIIDVSKYTPGPAFTKNKKT